jgi:hypothetical protein
MKKENIVSLNTDYQFMEKIQMNGIYSLNVTILQTQHSGHLDNKLISSSNKWIIQFPRIFDYLEKSKAVKNFEEYLLSYLYFSNPRHFLAFV